LVSAKNLNRSLVSAASIQMCASFQWAAARNFSGYLSIVIRCALDRMLDV
jgi:hypothetical protein